MNAVLWRLFSEKDIRSPVSNSGVREGIHSALQRAKDAANGRDEQIGGGVATIQQYLRAGLSTNFTSHFARFLWLGGEPIRGH
jgi:dihydrofolate reductase